VPLAHQTAIGSRRWHLGAGGSPFALFASSQFNQARALSDRHCWTCVPDEGASVATPRRVARKKFAQRKRANFPAAGAAVPRATPNNVRPLLCR
jgi:hypothetical protein